jgi:hypothetical protein
MVRIGRTTVACRSLQLPTASIQHGIDLAGGQDLVQQRGQILEAQQKQPPVTS